MKRVTIKDVAAEAGVSFSAVSRALQHDGKVSPETRRKVLETASRLGYRPSPIARGLVRQRSRLVTLVTGPTQSFFDTLFFDALAAGLAERGRHLMVATVRSEADIELGLMQAIDYRSEMVVVSAGTMSLDLSSQCVSAGIPVVLAGRVLAAPGVHCVLADNAGGGRQAGELLARVTSGPLAYFGQGGRTFSDRERADGFHQALEGAGRQARTYALDEFGVGLSHQQAALALLTQPERPRGVFCSNDGIAIDLLQAAMLLGLKVPDDLSIVGFDNVPMADWPAFRLTTVDYPVATLADTILGMADRIADGGEVLEPGATRIPTRLVVRQTTPAGFPASPA